MSSLPPNSLFVITGITGYIASHAGLEALKAGYRVRGTVRDLSKAEQLRAAYTKHGVDASPARLEFVVTDDMLSESQLAAAFKGAHGVAHIALPDFDPSLEKSFVDQTIDSVTIPLKIAAKESSIKRFVLTSSSAALGSGPNEPEHVVDEEDWNEEAIQRWRNATPEQLSEGANAFWLNYRAAKTLAEKAAWEFIKTEKPGYEFVTVLPVATWGPTLSGPAKLTASMITNLVFKGDASVLGFPLTWYIDVRDAGRIHVLALTLPEVANRRIIAAAGPISLNEVLGALRVAFPKANLPEDLVGTAAEPTKVKMNSELARKALGGNWISLKDAVVDTAKSVEHYY